MANKTDIKRNPNGRINEVSGTLFVMALAILILPLVAGCSNDCSECPDPAGTYAPPYPPDGVFSITGNGEVTLVWNDKPENFDLADNPYDDVVRYGIWVSSDPYENYGKVGEVTRSEACEDGLCSATVASPNGVDRYFAVTSIDRRGVESEDLSYEYVVDTPRPEGWLVLKDLGQNAAESGYDFDMFTVQAWNFNTTDIYFGQSDGIFYFYAAAGVDIQDFGYVAWEAVDVAPDDGYAESDRAEVVLGHVYIIRIQSGQDQNYAKIEVTQLMNDPNDLDDKVFINWAYQEVENLPELAPVGGAAQ